MPFGLRRPGSVLGGSESLRSGSDAGVFVDPDHAEFASATLAPHTGPHTRRVDPYDPVSLPVEAGPHSRRGDDFSFVVPTAYPFAEATLPPATGAHGRRGDGYSFVPVPGYGFAEATVAADSETHTLRGDAYSFVVPTAYPFAEATTALVEPGVHTRRVLDFAIGDRATHHGDAIVPTADPGTHTRRADGYTFVVEPAYAYAEARVAADAGTHTRRADAYLRVTIEGSAEVVALGSVRAFGAARAVPEIMGLGAARGAGRRSDFHVLGLGTPAAAGRKTAREVVGIGVASSAGQRSTPPEMSGLGAPRGHGAARGVPEAVGLGTAAALGHRQSVAPGEVVGLGEVHVPALAQPEAAGVGDTAADGQRLFRRRYLAPGWIKMRARQLEEWTTEPPPLELNLEVERVNDTAWHGPFDWATYTEDFYPGDFSKRLLALDATTALYIYRHQGDTAGWVPPLDSPYYNASYTIENPRLEWPVCARRLVLDPDTGAVSAGPEIVMTAHPLVDGAGDNDPNPDTGRNDWVTNPRWWSPTVVSTSPTETRVLMRLFDGTGFYDPLRVADNRIVKNGTNTYYDHGWTSAGMIVFSFDWTTGTVTKGPFNRLGGPVGVKPEYWGGEVDIATLPSGEAYYDQNPTEWEWWDIDEAGDWLILTEMLTATRGVTYFANARVEPVWSQLWVQSFDVVGDTVVWIDRYEFPGGGDPPELRQGHLATYRATRLLVLTATRFAIVGGEESADLLRCWSFELDPDGVVLYHGGASFGNETDNLYWNSQVLPIAVVRPTEVVFVRNDPGSGWRAALAGIRIPPTGAPTFRPDVMSSGDFAHPEQVFVPLGETEAVAFSEDIALEGDGAGHWVAVWTGWMDQPPNYDQMYARGGRVEATGSASFADAVRISDPGSDANYNWSWWSAFLGPNRMLYGWLADSGTAYAVRTAVVEISGGPDQL